MRGATTGVVIQPPSMTQLAALIPARQQYPALAPLVDSLLEAGSGAVILVEDGSPTEHTQFFESLVVKPRVHLLRHAVNLGKGRRALQTGINYFVTMFPGFAGLVTADADGQHSANDILSIARAFMEAPDCPVLGE